MQNPILQNLNNNGQGNIMMQAIGAMMRGESPQTFLQNLAKTRPELQGLDLSDPNKAAEQLYSQKGQDINTARSSIMDKINSFIGKG